MINPWAGTSRPPTAPTHLRVLSVLRVRHLPRAQRRSMKHSINPNNQTFEQSINPNNRTIDQSDHSLHPPPGSQTTEDSETGSAGHGRRLEIFAPHVHRPLARNPCETEGLPVLNPKEDFSNCLPCPAKRVSAHSVVDYAYAPHPAIRGQTDQSAKEYKPQKYISTRQPMLQD